MVKTCPIKIPKSVIFRMVEAGCTCEEARGEGLVVLRTEVGSQAWGIFADWASGLGEVDPAFHPIWNPSLEILGSLLVPQPALIGPILSEVASIITHCAPMLIGAFAMGSPLIPGPLLAPQIPVNVHDAKIAVTGILQLIQDPPSNYPTLSSLRSGSYICHTYYQWTGAAVVAAVFKS